MEKTIEVIELSKNFGALKAIDRVSFEVGRGEIVGFLGPNGAGKSTTMRILCGLTAATSGRAYLCGIPVASHANETKRLIGYMPEHNPLPEDMRVVEYLRHRAVLKEVPRRKVRAAVDEAMELCDLQRKARRRIIRTLSKGFRQRVGIADALLANPEVIIMDEPTIGLDPHQVLGIRRLIDSLRGRMTVILSSHILAEIELSCDRVIIINQGRIVAQGDATSLRREFLPHNTYRVELNGNLEHLGEVIGQVDSGLTIKQQSAADADGFHTVELQAPMERQLSEPLLEHLRANGWRVREFSRANPSLEDIFLAATKRSWEQTDPVNPKSNS